MQNIFYWLEESYDGGLLRVSDESHGLKSDQKYNNANRDDGKFSFQPLPTQIGQISDCKSQCLAVTVCSIVKAAG